MTPILGAAQCSAETARRWATGHGAPAYWADLASTYWDQAPRLGVRADVAYAQAAKETNFGRFGGVIDASFHNPCGLKTAAGGGNYDPDAHTRFPGWATGIRAHIEHLHLYAKGPVSDPVDPRHFPSLAGTAPIVEALSGRWAPSSTYHESILRYVEEMSTMTDSPGVTIVSRHQWRARPATSRYAIATPTPELWLHHFASEHHGPVGMRAIQAYHIDTKGWSDIAYSFCVDDNGDIYEGRGVGIAGGHTKNRNSISHAICLMGNFQQRPVPRAAMQSAAALAAHGIEAGWWTGWTSGHRNAPGASTSCPGDYAMRAWKDLTALTDLYRSTPPTEDMDDMHAGEIIASYMEAYGNPTKQQGKDIRTWIHAIYGKPPAERDGGVAYIRALLGLS